MSFLSSFFFYSTIICIILYIIREIYIRLNLKKLKGEIVLITGGGSGIGRLLAIKLAKQQCKIILWDKNETGLKETAEQIKKFGGSVFYQVCDITSEKEISENAEKIRKQIGNVTMLINNAGIVTGKKFMQSTTKEMNQVMQVNTLSHFYTVKEFAPSMIEKNHGHIITIASAAGIIGVSGLVDYSASKFGAFGFTESLRFELRKMAPNINTLCVCPYFINTGMFDGVRTKFPFLLPILDPDYVTDRIILSIQRRDEILCLPSFVSTVWLVRFLLPVFIQDYIAEFLGFSESMETFRGRSIPQKSEIQKKNE